MVSKQQKEMKKKKAREKDSHEKVLAMRGKIRANAKEKRMEHQREIRIDRLQRDIDRLDIHTPVDVKILPDNVLDQLENNVKILEALEQEHAEEKKARKKLNAELEDQGKSTLNEKLNSFRNNLSVDYKAPEPPQRQAKDVSDVEIVRASNVEAVVEDVEDVNVSTEVEENS